MWNPTERFRQVITVVDDPWEMFHKCFFISSLLLHCKELSLDVTTARSGSVLIHYIYSGFVVDVDLGRPILQQPQFLQNMSEVACHLRAGDCGTEFRFCRGQCSNVLESRFPGDRRTTVEDSQPGNGPALLRVRGTCSIQNSN